MWSLLYWVRQMIGRPEAESDEGIPPRIMIKTHRILRPQNRYHIRNAQSGGDSRYRGLLAFDQRIVLSCTGEPQELLPCSDK